MPSSRRMGALGVVGLLKIKSAKGVGMASGGMGLTRRLAASLRRRGVFGLLWALVADTIVRFGHVMEFLRDHVSPCRFESRSTGSSELIVVLAGYKSYLWPITLARIKRYAPRGADICVASAGLFSDDLAVLCRAHGWSYLSVTRNSPGLALNKCVRLHPHADFIYKIDEDVVIAKDFFELLRKGYDLAWSKQLLEPGFCAPVLNLNGISYRAFLRQLGLEEEFSSAFGPLLSRCGDLPVHNDPRAAWWIWERTLPFDRRAEEFSRRLGEFSICATRFSIGAILFRRGFHEQTGGFKSAWHSAVLGVDEDMLCRDCVAQSRPMIIVESVLAGHFSFYPQESFMREKLPEMMRMDPGLVTGN